jgi:hypothetical protein
MRYLEKLRLKKEISPVISQFHLPLCFLPQIVPDLFSFSNFLIHTTTEYPHSGLTHLGPFLVLAKVFPEFLQISETRKVPLTPTTLSFSNLAISAFLRFDSFSTRQQLEPTCPL